MGPDCAERRIWGAAQDDVVSAAAAAPCDGRMVLFTSAPLDSLLSAVMRFGEVSLHGRRPRTPSLCGCVVCWYCMGRAVRNGCNGVLRGCSCCTTSVSRPGGTGPN